MSLVFFVVLISSFIVTGIVLGVVIRSVCVFSGSSFGDHPVYAKTAAELGQALAMHNLNLVYGGSDLGLMGALSGAHIRASAASGPRCFGVIPRFLFEQCHMPEGIFEVIVTRDMHTRKAEMFRRADAFVALPGGIGTLEELVEIITWAQLHQHQKPIFILNIHGFWNELLALFRHFITSGFMQESALDGVVFVDDVDDFMQHITVRLTS